MNRRDFIKFLPASLLALKFDFSKGIDMGLSQTLVDILKKRTPMRPGELQIFKDYFSKMDSIANKFSGEDSFTVNTINAVNGLPLTLAGKITVTAANQANSYSLTIPPEGTHILIVTAAGSATAGTNETMLMQFNGDTGANYQWLWNEGQDGSHSSGRNAGEVSLPLLSAAGSGASADSASAGVTWLPHYNSDKWKTLQANYGLLFTAGVGFGTSGTFSGWWEDTSKIRSIRFFGANSFSVGSVISVYVLA